MWRKQKSFILSYFVYSETFLIGETVPRAGIRSCRFQCTDVQEHRKQDQGWAMSLLVPHKNNLANVTIPYAKKLPYVRPSCKVEYGNYTRVIYLRHCEILTKVNKLCAAFFFLLWEIRNLLWNIPPFTISFFSFF